MSDKEIFELLCAALPGQADPSAIFGVNANGEYLFAPDGGYANFLRTSGHLDWQAYLEANPDLQACGVNPVEHFISDGIFEGRKLCLKNPGGKDDGHCTLSLIISSPPQVPEIIAQVLDSGLTGLPGLEIVVARQQGNTLFSDIYPDGYPENCALNIKFADIPPGLGIHAARKAGIGAATGRYAIFLDKQSPLPPEIWVRLFNAVKKGYDLAAFIKQPVLENDVKTDAQPRRDVSEPTDSAFYGYEILEASYRTQTIQADLQAKAFDYEIARVAFSLMQDDCPDAFADYYEFLVIASLCRSMTVIYKETDSEISGQFAAVDKSKIYVPAIASAAECLEAMLVFCMERGMDSVYKSAKKMLFQRQMAQLDHIPDGMIATFFDTVVYDYGLAYVVRELIALYHNDISTLAQRFGAYVAKARPDKPKSLAMLYSRIEGGGIETTIRNICKLLEPAGYQIVLILYEKIRKPELIGANINVRYIPAPANDVAAMREHMDALANVLAGTDIDVLFDWWIHGKENLWHSILCHLMGIPIIGSLRYDHNFELLMRGRSYPHKTLLSALRCLDKLFCLTISSEIYLRSCGIDAIYIPNTIRYAPRLRRKRAQTSRVAILCRLHDKVKGLDDALLVASEVRKILPESQFCVIGEFEKPGMEQLFTNRVRELNLTECVSLTGWLSDPAPVLLESDVFLCTSMLEGFPNSISEAQACGLPVVMYELDIMMANDNESIIQVPQKDVQKAASAIVELLENGEKRSRLAQIAIEKTRRFSQERFKNEIIELLENHATYSPARYYSPADYARAIHFMAFYAGQLMPA